MLLRNISHTLFVLILFTVICSSLYTDLSGVINLKPKKFKGRSQDSDNVWLVNFYTSLSQKSLKLARAYLEVAEKLKGRIHVGGLNCKDYQEFCAEFGYRDSPVIRYYPAGLKGDFATYNGKLDSDEIMKWALGNPPVDNEEPQVTEITGKSIVDRQCGQRVLCIIAFLPNLLDCQSDCRHDHLKMMQSLSSKYKKQGWGWLWSEGGSQKHLEASLNVGGFGYPSLAVLSVKKMQYSVLLGAFQKKNIDDYLKQLSTGKMKTYGVPDKVIPKIEKLSPWDGHDKENLDDNQRIEL